MLKQLFEIQYDEVLRESPHAMHNTAVIHQPQLQLQDENEFEKMTYPAEKWPTHEMLW